MKVLALNASRHELDIMLRLKTHADSPLSKYVVQLLDSFEHASHLCLVMELMWQNIHSFLEGYTDDAEGHHLPLVRNISRQLLEGLEFLQDCGVIHNG